MPLLEPLKYSALGGLAASIGVALASLSGSVLLFWMIVSVGGIAALATEKS